MTSEASKAAISSWRWGWALCAPAVVLTGLFLATRAHHGIARSTKTPGAKPRVSVASTEYEVRNAEPGAVLEHEFVVRNVGDHRLVVNLAGCNCMRNNEKPAIVMPGQKLTIPLSFKVRPFPARQEKTELYSTSDPTHPQIELKLIAKLFTPATTESSIRSPSDLAAWGQPEEDAGESTQP